MDSREREFTRARWLAYAVTGAQRARLAIALVLVARVVLGTSPVLAVAPLELFTRPGCPQCEEAYRFTDELRERRPNLTIVVHDVVADPGARADLERAVRDSGRGAASLPTFRVGAALVVGFDSAQRTGPLIEALLDGPFAAIQVAEAACPVEAESTCAEAAAAPRAADAVDVSLLGRLDAGELGLPLFTVAIGLVDGFNPCAMWVLLFLLAMLVNLRDRRRILAIAGTFVVVSGLAYFAFMAAWLNAFLLVGFLRPAQIVLGLFALVVGAVHVKDFFALGVGFSLSIPASAKPGIYARARSIVAARSLWLAIAGAFALAVVVNVIELLCTAGLPALYTQILARQGLSPSAQYGYLALYVAAYMLDDALMVGIAVVTLGKRKLQERGGRWLKLLSGLTILILGALLLGAPDSLVW